MKVMERRLILYIQQGFTHVKACFYPQLHEFFRKHPKMKAFRTSSESTEVGVILLTSKTNVVQMIKNRNIYALPRLHG